MSILQAGCHASLSLHCGNLPLSTFFIPNFIGMQCVWNCKYFRKINFNMAWLQEKLYQKGLIGCDNQVKGNVEYIIICF